MKGLLIALMALLPLSAQASVIFDLRGAEGAAVDGMARGVVTKAGITATLYSLQQNYIDTNGITRSILLNQTGSGFGLNVDGVANTGGCTNEQSSQVDNGCLRELLVVEFSQNVILDSVQVSLIGSSDTAAVDFESGGASTVIASSGLHLINEIVGGIGNRFRLGLESGNGFSFDAFTVSSVPEPGSIALLGLGLAALGLRRKRR